MSCGRQKRAVLLAAVLMAATSCGGNPGADNRGASSSVPMPVVANAAGLRSLSGTWTGEWQAETEVRGTFRLEWSQVGRVMRGVLTIEGAACPTGGDVQGLLNGSSIDISVQGGPVEVRHTGTVQGDTMSGNYTTSCPAANNGTWRATRTR